MLSLLSGTAPAWVNTLPLYWFVLFTSVLVLFGGDADDDVDGEGGGDDDEGGGDDDDVSGRVETIMMKMRVNDVDADCADNNGGDKGAYDIMILNLVRPLIIQFP